MKKAIIICESYHHFNTLKIAKAMSKVLDCEVKRPKEISPTDILSYDLIGFGSGIYDDLHHLRLLKFVDEMPENSNKDVFVFSTTGIPIKIFGYKFIFNYEKKAHKPIKEKLESKGCKVLSEFICPGFNTNSFLKWFGGLNKGRPDANDLKEAKEFVEKIL